MKPIEDRMADFFMRCTNQFLARIIKPDVSVDNVNSLTIEDIRNLKASGIKGVVLDVDETIRKDMKKIPKCNQEWIDTLKKELKVIIVSNGFDKDVQEFFTAKGIDYIGFAVKPLKRNLRKACERMGLKPEEVALIGNDYFSDIFGGNRINMKTIKVQDVQELEDLER